MSVKTRSKRYGEHPYGSRPMTRFQRWEESRTLCIAVHCMYAYACPMASQRPRYVAKRSCYRHQPLEQRPSASLSPFALELVKSYQEKREQASSASPATGQTRKAGPAI